MERSRQLYGLYEQEANLALEKGLVLPAYDYLLKCSQTFNVLDTRGAIGVTERQALFSRMREVAHRVSEQYLEQRQHLEYPWMKEDTQSSLVGARQSAGVHRRKASEDLPTRPVILLPRRNSCSKLAPKSCPLRTCNRPWRS